MMALAFSLNENIESNNRSNSNKSKALFLKNKLSMFWASELGKLPTRRRTPQGMEERPKRRAAFLLERLTKASFVGA